MRVLWHAAHPDLPTGYANQTAIWLARLHKAGHQVAVSCLGGVTSFVTGWRVPGTEDIIPVYPMTPYENYGQDVLGGHYKHWQADLVISLTCTWVYNPDPWRGLRAIFISPTDIEGMGRRDVAMITDSGGTPAAVCRWGETQMRARDLDPLYLPHGVETADVYHPLKNRKRSRQAKNLDHLFLVGINAQNHERARKNFPDALAAFARFHAKHPGSMLLLHTLALLPEGINLPLLAAELGISNAIIWSDQYAMATGMTSQQALADWYGCLDLLMMVGNEGFGLPTVEAMACGTPVLAGDWGPHPELLAGSGWLCDGQEDWNNWHGKFWCTPVVDSVVAQLEAAYGELSDQEGARRRRLRAREAALLWDADRVWEESWVPVVKELAG